MQNPSDPESPGTAGQENWNDDYPTLDPQYFVNDPVKLQKRKDRILFTKRPLEVIPETGSLISAKITPSMGTRIDLHQAPQSTYQEGKLRPKYIIRKTKKQLEFFEKNRAYTYKKFCKYGTVKMADPITAKTVTGKFEAPSPEASKAHVAPRKVTPTASWLYPDPQTTDELALKKPKSGIFINETQSREVPSVYDSFDLVFKRKPRPESKAAGASKKRKKNRRKAKTAKKAQPQGELLPEEEYLAIMMEMELEMQQLGESGEGHATPKDYLTKQFRRKVSMMSQSTSYQSKDYEMDRDFSLTETTLDKYAQKFRRESEIKRYEPKKRRFRRGTLESHSFTNIYQPTLKEFYFGSKPGSMHQGDEHLPAGSQNMQGICIPVAAYCFSFLKHPDKWSSENVDEILDVGSRLYLSSLNNLHVHRSPAEELRPEDLDKYCFIRDKKIRFTIDDPEVSGMIKSTDRTVFNLTKALNIFFARQKAGILQTQDTNLALWKDRYFYMFDGKPRTKDLYYTLEGTAMMANFYDIPSVVTVLLQRSCMQNWPFVIYPIKTFKVLDKDQEDDEDKSPDLDVRSNYNILNENKAVLLGSYDLGDKCFGFTRNKQSLAMAVVCLVYSRITPPSAWRRTTVDKIMVIGNQLYVECMKCDEITELKLNTIPAFFTIGPYIVEIYIYVNRIVDMMYEKCNCQLKCSLDMFFQTNTNAILEINNCYLGVWKQRNMFFCFDPYPRGNEAYKSRDGYSCVSMHATIESLVDVITHNFDDKDGVFKLHALKVCKINRDPVMSQRFPKHIPLDEFPPDDFKNFKMQKSKKSATEKPVTVDYSALAMRSLLMGQTPDPSIFEIGSNVGSLGLDQIPPLLHADRVPPKLDIFPRKPADVEIVADLDSPSLSDTQIPPPRQVQIKDPSEVLMDLDSFALTQEEIELEQVVGEGYDEDGYEGEEDWEGRIAEEMEGQLGEGEDIYYAADEYAQVRTESLVPVVVSEEINTDLTYFPIRREVLYPTYVRGKQQMKSRLNKFKKPFDFDEDYAPQAPDVTQSEELRKETNFVDLPDDTQIIRGTKNVSAFGEEVEFMAPFVCVMACVVAKKYSILSWTPEIVDYILKCGVELYNASKFRYDQVSKLEIPQISLGKTKFACLVEYVFDSYIRQNILELAIEKILFIRSDMGVLVTPTYACCLIYKNHLYYMYDGFGSNEVGLSEGMSDTGTACFSRFKDVHSLVTRIIYNKLKRESNEEVVYTRFVLSTVRVKRLHPSAEKVTQPKKPKATADKEAEEEEMAGQGGEDNYLDEDRYTEHEAEERKDPETKVGYQYKNKRYVIEGTRAIVAGDGDENEEKEQQKRSATAQLQEDHFSCICACLMLLSLPVEKWDTKKVDEVLDHGSHIYSHADDLDISEKRTIKNILIRKNFFDIIVKRVRIENWKDNRTLSAGVDTVLRKKMSYFLVQFPGGCYAVHKSPVDDTFHVFYSKGLPPGKKDNNTEDEDDEGEGAGAPAGWLRCKDIKAMKRRLKNAAKANGDSYDFYTFEVTSIRKAPKDMLINYRLNQYDVDKPKKSEQIGKPFYEDAEWLLADPVPWSRMAAKNPEGKDRGTPDTMWHNWDIEYLNDLYSLLGNIHQDSDRFPEKCRGKQTLCNLVTCIGMMEIYDLTEWNAAVVDSVLVNGNQYFQDCVQDIKDKDYELSVDDLKEDSSIFPFNFKVHCKPIVEGTMFLVRNTQFNLYKALRMFFDNFDRRAGIVCCSKSGTKKNLGFGKCQKREYFMFDSDAHGSPMFLEGEERAYILRMTSLNRLLHALTLTLRGGDFFIFEVTITDVKPIS